MKHSFGIATILLLATVSVAAADLKASNKVELPGFSLRLPAGEVTKSTSLPSAGSHQIRPAVTGVANPMVSVYWTQHGKTHAEWVVMNRDKVFGSFFQGTSRVSNEQSLSAGRWIALLGDAQSGAGVGIVTCEPGFSIMFVINVSNRNADDLRVIREVAKSVQCALTDANRHRPDATARLSSRFARIPIPDAQHYYSLDDELIMVNIVAGNSFAHGIDGIETFMLGILANSVKLAPDDLKFARLQSEEAPEGSRLLARVDGHPEVERRYFGVIYCKDLAATINLVSLLPEFNDPRARQLFEEFSCPGGRSTELGDIHDVLLETCAAGKAFACGLRERL